MASLRKHRGVLSVERPLVRRSFQRPSGETWVLAIDCSASMLKDNTLASVQAAVNGLASQAYRERRELAVICFGGAKSEVLLPARRAPKKIATLFEGLTVGGGTPLHLALEQAEDMARKQRIKHSDSKVHLWLFTDGRCQQMPTMTKRLSVTVVDTEKGLVKLRQCAKIASLLQARYLSLDAFVSM